MTREIRIGDRVKVKPLLWYIHKRTDTGVVIGPGNQFTEIMSEWCGKSLTIKGIYPETQTYKVEENGFIWKDWMFEKKKLRPTKREIQMEEKIEVESKSGIEEETVSIKNDKKDGKLPWDLLPLEDVENIVEVYAAGAKKYGPDRWQNLPDGYQRYKAAMLRHLLEYEKGNRIDSDTGCMHLAQVAWNAIAMLHLDKAGKGLIKSKRNED